MPRQAPLHGRGAGERSRGRASRVGPAALGSLLFLLAALPVLQMMGCGARSELYAPGGGEGGAPGCTETQTAAFSASIGGGIHHIFTECMPRPDAGDCPSADEAKGLLQPQNCSSIEEIECGPIVKPDQCCYVALELCALT